MEKSEQSSKLAKLLERIKSDVDAQNFDFLESLPKEIQTECSICLHMLKEPYIVECCGYRFCKQCITSIAGQPCPLCKSAWFQKLPDKQLQRLLNQRKVYCLLKAEGCTWEGEMDKVYQHLQLDCLLKAEECTWEGEMGNDSSVVLTESSGTKITLCDYVPVTCTYCMLALKRKDMSDHKSVCVKKEVECEYCNTTMSVTSISSHHKHFCLQYPEHCRNNCTLKIFTRNDLYKHLKTDCPLEKIECEYGCGASVFRKEMADHIKESTEEHLSLVFSRYKKMKENYKTLKDRISRSKGYKDIEFILVSNLSENTHEQMIQSRFGQIGTVRLVQMIPSHNAAIIEFEHKEVYSRVIEQSHSINLLKHRLKVTPIYSTTTTFS